VTPIDVSCVHSSTEAELQRDPEYRGCFAQPGQPCQWARRADGGEIPPFHTERIEASVADDSSGESVPTAEFNQAVEADGSIF
jgi:hypothetical protein